VFKQKGYLWKKCYKKGGKSIKLEIKNNRYENLKSWAKMGNLGLSFGPL